MKAFTIITASVLLALACSAQQEPMVSQYMFNGLFINPAYAGSNNYSTAMLLYRKQWVNFDGAPVTQVLSYEGPVKNKKIGLGFTLINDHIGVSNRTDFDVSYAYHLRVGTGHLSMGLRGGVAYYKAKLSDLTVWDAGDNVFASDVSGKVLPNIGAGVYYYLDNFYAGLSVPNLFSYKQGQFLYIAMENTPRLQRHYYFTSGYTWTINDAVAVRPSVLFKYIPAAPFEADINLNLIFKQMMSVGFSYRTGDSFVGMLELNVTKQLRVGYAFDYAFSPIRNYSSGTHEIKIAYLFGQETKKFNAPRIFKSKE